MYINQSDKFDKIKQLQREINDLVDFKDEMRVQLEDFDHLNSFQSAIQSQENNKNQANIPAGISEIQALPETQPKR